MKIMIVGYGKMGRMIEAAALSRGHEISAKVDPLAPGVPFREICPEAAAGADVAVEFTLPSAAPANIEKLLALGVPVVAGTTGWTGELGRIRAAVDASGGALVHGANFSVGVNLLYRIVAEAARLMDGFPQYDVGGFETHHNQKADSPSGTAKALASILLDRIRRKNVLVTETLADRRPRAEDLQFSSLRVGSVPGTHTVFFDSPSDTIELSHTARSREGFALGTVLAAEWLLSSGLRGTHGVEEMYAEI